MQKLFFMSKNVLLLFCFVLSTVSMSGQRLIPFLAKNGLYGYADQDNKVVIAAAFREAPFFDSLGIAEVTLPSYEKSFLLRSGTLIPKNGQMLSGLVSNMLDLSRKRDTAIADLFQFHSYSHSLLLQRNTGKFKQYLAPTTNAANLGFDPLSLKISAFSGYYKGYKKVQKPSGVNFVDTKLEEVFPSDVADGVYVGGNYFIICDAQKKFGVVSTSGKAIVPFSYKSIGATLAEGIFILNYREYRNQGDSSNLIIFSAKTNHSITLDYDSAKPFGDFLLVHSRGKYGLIDYEGKVVVPCEYSMFSEMTGSSETLRNRFIFSTNTESFLFDGNGRSLLPEKFSILTYHNPRYTVFPENVANESPFIIGSRSQIGGQKAVIVVMDANLKTKFVDSTHSRLSPNFTGFGRFFYSMHAVTSKSGVLSELGKQIIPAEFTSIDLVQGKAFIVKKDSFCGMMDLQGTVVFPCKYETIQIEQDHSAKNKFVVWAKEYGNSLYYAYELDGKAAKYRPFHYPTMSDSRATFPSSRYENGKFFQKTRTGKEVESTLISGYQLIKSGNEFLYYKTERRFLDLRNQDFERIVPKGFKAVATQQYILPGLFVVVNGQYEDQVSRVSAESDAVREAPGPPPPPGSDAPIPERAIGVKTEKGPEVVLDERGPDRQGVIDSKGAWVIPAKVGGDYQIVGKYLVSEKTKAERNRTSFTLHLLKHPKETKIVGLSNIIPTKKSIISISKYLPRSGGGMEEFSCILDSLGNELTDFNLVRLEHFHELGDTITAIIRKGNGNNETVLMDLSAKIIARLGEDRITEVDKIGGRLILRNEESGLYRITDLHGKQMKKELYKDLKLQRSDSSLFYLGTTRDGKNCLFNDFGFNTVMPTEFDSLISMSNAYAYPLDGGQVLLSGSSYRGGTTKGFSILLSAKGDVLQTYSASYMHESRSQRPAEADYLRFRSADHQKAFYINRVTGVEYRE